MIQSKEDNEEDCNNGYERKLAEVKSFLLVRVITNNFRLTSTIENKKIHMKNLLNFSLINLMYQTNLASFEKIKLDIINDTDARVFIRMVHFFKELGLKHRYICFDIKKIQDKTDSIVFVLTQNQEYGIQVNDSLSAELLPITHMIYDFKLVSPHKLNLTQYIHFDSEVTIPYMIEPLFGIILKTMFKRTQKFIEQLK